jgi:hypothetical protein
MHFNKLEIVYKLKLFMQRVCQKENYLCTFFEGPKIKKMQSKSVPLHVVKKIILNLVCSLNRV